MPGRDRDVVIADGVGVAGGIAAGAVPVSMHPGGKNTADAENYQAGGPDFPDSGPLG